MEREAASLAALTLASATVAGIVSQSVARSLKIPGIVVLLAVGVLFGPDFAGIIDPSTLGAAMPEVVSFAVAVILFEGGLHLELRKFRKQQKPIRRLVTWGAIITAIGGTLAAKVAMDWSWSQSALFGCLVIVTGPTVVTPLVRRFRLVPRVGSVLEAEGVLIDAVGAVIAVVALEVAIHPTADSVAKGVVGVPARLALGALLGLAGGFLMWGLFRYKNLVAEGLENVVTLALVWALFKGADAIVHESGVAAVTVAGLVLGNVRTRIHSELLAFQDQLTVMLIGMLFVLLAANVRMDDVLALGWPGVITVVLLIVVVRPLNVLASTAKSELDWKSKLYISWIGPRGIIAAAVASLFASELAHAGMPGGNELKALVFLVIAVTVVLAGLTGGGIARLLKLSREPRGWLLLGANAVSCALAKVLTDAGEEVVCVDNSVDHCQRAGDMGVKVIRGNGLDDEVLAEARIQLRAGAAALTPNDEINLLFIQKAKRLGKVSRLLAALRSATAGATTDMVHKAGGQVLFADDYDITMWSSRLELAEATVERLVAGPNAQLGHDVRGATLFLPLAHHRGTVARPIADDIVLKTGDEITAVLSAHQRSDALRFITERGFRLATEAPPKPVGDDDLAPAPA